MSTIYFVGSVENMEMKGSVEFEPLSAASLARHMSLSTHSGPHIPSCTASAGWVGYNDTSIHRYNMTCQGNCRGKNRTCCLPTYCPLRYEMWVGGCTYIHVRSMGGGQCRLRASDRPFDKHNHDIDACKQDFFKKKRSGERCRPVWSRGEIS